MDISRLTKTDNFVTSRTALQKMLKGVLSLSKRTPNNNSNSHKQKILVKVPTQVNISLFKFFPLCFLNYFKIIA